MVKSPNKVITSGTAPTTTNTSKGDLAFGIVDGETKLYGNNGTEVVELGGGGGSEVNVVAPLKVDTAPTADDGDKKSIVIGDKAVSTLGDTSGLPEEIKEGLDAMVSAYGGTNNVVVGGSGIEHENAKGEGLYNVSIGPGAQAGILEYDAENPQSMTKLMNNVAVGVDAVANGGESIAIGAVKATGSGSIAIGGSNATSEGEVVISSGTMYGGGRHGGAIIASRGVVQGLEDAPNVVISSSVSADSRGGQGVVAIGGAQIDIYGGGPAVDAIAIGRNAYIYHADSNERSVAIGAETYVGSAGSVAIGHGSRASGAYVFSVGSGNTGHNGATRRIINVTNPVNAQDAATKNYVDAKVSEIPAGPQGPQGDPGPQGEPGVPGAAATITVGTTTTGEAGTEATVTNSGTTSAAVLNFTIPKGAKGDKGDKGETGDTGPAGTTTFAGLTDQPTDNAALKAALDAKANQTALDAKVSSVTAGTGISITGSATAPVVNGMIAVPDYDNAQYVFPASSKGDFTAPSDGVIYRVRMNDLHAGGQAMLSVKVSESSSQVVLSTATNSSDVTGGVSIAGVFPVQKGTLAWVDRNNGQSDVSALFYFAPYKFVEIS